MTRVQLRVNPDLTLDWRCPRGRKPGTNMVEARGQVLTFEPDTNGFDYVSWRSDGDNREILRSDYGWAKEWLQPLHNLHEAVEL